jgi:DNA-binding transcriptional MerR regulator
MAQQEPTRRRTGGAGPTGPIAHAREIPDKLYFRIGEVARLCDVPAYVLRFWESEFPQLKPNKGGTGQRLYRRRDVEMALKVKSLLYDEGYTIAGARQAFKTERTGAARGAASLAGAAEPEGSTVPVAAAASAPGAQQDPAGNPLLQLQKELRELHAMLSKPAVSRQTVTPIRAPRPLPAPAAARPATPAPTPFARPRLLTPIKPAAPAKVERGLFDGLFPAE